MNLTKLTYLLFCAISVLGAESKNERDLRLKLAEAVRKQEEITRHQDILQQQLDQANRHQSETDAALRAAQQIQQSAIAEKSALSATLKHQADIVASQAAAVQLAAQNAAHTAALAASEHSSATAERAKAEKARIAAAQDAKESIGAARSAADIQALDAAATASDNASAAQAAVVQAAVARERARERAEQMNSTADSKNNSIIVTSLASLLTLIAGFIWQAYRDSRDHNWAKEAAELGRVHVEELAEVKIGIGDVKVEAHNAYTEANHAKLKLEDLRREGIDTNKAIAEKQKKKDDLTDSKLDKINESSRDTQDAVKDVVVPTVVLIKDTVVPVPGEPGVPATMNAPGAANPDPKKDSNAKK